jgi:hypothetical protein
MALELVGAVEHLKPHMVDDVVDELRASASEVPAAERVQQAVANAVSDDEADGDVVRLRTTALSAVKPRVTAMARAEYLAMLRRAMREAKQEK